MSDHHFVNNKFIPPCNSNFLKNGFAFVYCGDLLRNSQWNSNINELIKTFFSWIQNLNVKYKIIILGNNDGQCLKNYNTQNCFKPQQNLLDLINAYNFIPITSFQEFKIDSFVFGFTPYSQSLIISNNQFGQNIPLNELNLNDCDVIFSHGAFRTNVKNKIFVHGHTHAILNHGFNYKANKTNKSNDLIYFNYKNNTYINVSLSDNPTLNDRNSFLFRIEFEKNEKVNVKSVFYLKNMEWNELNQTFLDFNYPNKYNYELKLDRPVVLADDLYLENY